VDVLVTAICVLTAALLTVLVATAVDALATLEKGR
jgi:hypothetical protein